jgi:hypothetical protein
MRRSQNEGELKKKNSTSDLGMEKASESVEKGMTDNMDEKGRNKGRNPNHGSGVEKRG